VSTSSSIVARVLVAALLLPACGDGSSDPSASDRPLDGRTFLSESVEGHALVPDTSLRLSFDDGQLSAQAGCNSLSGAYDVVDDRLTVPGDGMITTDMGCDPERHAQDEWLAALLQDRPRVDLQGSSLTLTTADATLHLVDRTVADPDRPLVGTRWTVDTVLQGDAASSVPDDHPVTLALLDDGALTAASDGCTSVRVEVSIDSEEGVLHIGEVIVDAIGCPTPWDEAVQLLRAGRIEFDIEATRLTLTADDMGLSAVAE
jgi:heat shock protein HslJ